MPLSRFHSVFAFGIDRASVTTFCHWRQFQNCFIRIHRAHAYRFFECMHSRNIIQTRLTKQTNRHRPKHTSKYNIQYVHPIRSSVSLLRLYHSAYSTHCRSSGKDGINGNPTLGCREVVEGPTRPVNHLCPNHSGIRSQDAGRFVRQASSDYASGSTGADQPNRRHPARTVQGHEHLERLRHGWAANPHQYQVEYQGLNLAASAAVWTSTSMPPLLADFYAFHIGEWLMSTGMIPNLGGVGDLVGGS